MEVNSIPDRLYANVLGRSSGWLRTANPEYSFFSPPQTVRKVLARLKYPVPLCKARSGFSILTEECLTFRTTSPSRGLVSYNSVSASFDKVSHDDERLSGGSVDVFPDAEIHTVFGDAHLLFCFLFKSGMAEVLKVAFPDEIERECVLCHILHSILRDGSRISCDNFIEKSFASYVLEDVPTASLRCDTAYFNMMGKDSVRLAFFKAFVERMREDQPRLREVLLCRLLAPSQRY